MSRIKRLSYEEKLKMCELYSQGKGSLRSIAKDYGITHHGLSLLYYKYTNFGPKLLKMKKQDRGYTREFKLKVIEAYRNGKGSYSELGIKYGIPNYSLIARWVLGYNKTIKSTYSRAGCYYDRKKNNFMCMSIYK